uniref:Uncharacterized protein n=1 Tax=Meloidogyne incognita TaxID=6306 RepID=A0A914LJ63_MELIC
MFPQIASCFSIGHHLIIIWKTFGTSMPDTAINFYTIIFLQNPSIKLVFSNSLLTTVRVDILDGHTIFFRVPFEKSEGEKALISINFVIAAFGYKCQMLFFEMICSKMTHAGRSDGH